MLTLSHGTVLWVFGQFLLGTSVDSYVGDGYASPAWMLLTDFLDPELLAFHSLGITLPPQTGLL